MKCPYCSHELNQVNNIDLKELSLIHLLFECNNQFCVMQSISTTEEPIIKKEWNVMSNFKKCVNCGTEEFSIEKNEIINTPQDRLYCRGCGRLMGQVVDT